VSQWVLLIGTSWSMLVIITFYTAQVAATVIFDQRTTQITSFTQAIEQNLKICGLNVLQQEIEERYDAVRTRRLFVGWEQYRDVVVGMNTLVNTGACDVGLITEDVYLVQVWPPTPSILHQARTAAREPGGNDCGLPVAQ